MCLLRATVTFFAVLAAGLLSTLGLAGKMADEGSLLQKPLQVQDNAVPHVVGLRRESVPIYRKGKIASFKTSYSGVLSLGSPPQDFRVVFDTGSAHVVLPAVECKSEACRVNHRRLYNQSASQTSVAINADGSEVFKGEMGEQVTIGFGTGEITGEFTRDTVCFGKYQTSDEAQNATIDESRWAEIGALIKRESLRLPDATNATLVDYRPLCVEMNVIAAIEMSTVPFKTFQFDGILGLSLDGLAMNKNFSTFDMLVRAGLTAKPHFGVFLSDGEDDLPSEVAFGSADPRRMLEPLAWSKVYMPEMGYWVVPIKSVRVDGVELDFCKDGTCRGVVDTGTSHLGVPAPYDKELQNMLQVDAGDLLDCRLAKSATVEIELEGKTLSLTPMSYMRRLPLRSDVTVSSSKGVSLDEQKQDSGVNAPGVVHFGSNPGPSFEKCVAVREAVACDPWAANNRTDRFPDRFHIYPMGDKMCVRRTDQQGAWSLNLTVSCRTGREAASAQAQLQKSKLGLEPVFLGANLVAGTATKCISPVQPIVCDPGSANHRGDFYNDSFHVFARHGQICATRTDLPGATWSIELVLFCKRDAPEERGDASCWDGHFTAERCCGSTHGDRGNPTCWDTVHTFERCCGGEVYHGPPAIDREEVFLSQESAKMTQPGADPAKRPPLRQQPTPAGKGKAKAPTMSKQGSGSAEAEQSMKRNCSPRLMAVKLPAPLGPKLFILGEPVLHRYYTVYDWEQKRVGFSLANAPQNTVDPATLGRGTLPKDVDMLLMQRKTTVKQPKVA